MCVGGEIEGERRNIEKPNTREIHGGGVVTIHTTSPLPSLLFFGYVLVQPYEVNSDILRGWCTFLPTLVQTFCSVVLVGRSSKISGGDLFVRFGDEKILSSCDCGMANRCRLLPQSFRTFSFRLRYDLVCIHLLVNFSFLDQVLPSCKWTWSPMFRGERFFFFVF